MVGAPKITNETGTGWAQSKQVSIQVLPGYTTMYTLDGTDPSATNGTAVTGQITLTEPKTVKAVFIQADTGNESDMSTLSVTKIDNLPPQKPTLTGYETGSGALGRLSLTLKDSTPANRSSGIKDIRYQRTVSGTWSAWETVTSSNYKLSIPIKFDGIAVINMTFKVEVRDTVRKYN